MLVRTRRQRFELCRQAIKAHLNDVNLEPVPDLKQKEVYVRGFFFGFAVYAGLIQEHLVRQTITLEQIMFRAEIGRCSAKTLLSLTATRSAG